MINDENITLICGVPVMFYFLYKILPENVRFPKVKMWVSGGEALSAKLQTELKSKFDIEVRQGYGITEASPIVSWTPPRAVNKYGSIGLPAPYNEVRINGEEVDGEILVKGINVVHGYFGDDAASKKFIVEGWLHTGDIGRFDSEGYLYITGRKKDMIIKSGYNVYPKEVEKIIKFHPDIEDVKIFREVDSSDELYPRELLRADVKIKDGCSIDLKTLNHWLQDNISGYKIPDTIKFIN